MRADRRRAMKTAKRLSGKIYPILAGEPPETQGAMLADLVAMWLIGFPDTLRPELLTLHLRYVMEFIPVNEHIMFGDAGHPENTTQSDSEKVH